MNLHLVYLSYSVDRVVSHVGNLYQKFYIIIVILVNLLHNLVGNELYVSRHRIYQYAVFGLFNALMSPRIRALSSDSLPSWCLTMCGQYMIHPYNRKKYT